MCSVPLSSPAAHTVDCFYYCYDHDSSAVSSGGRCYLPIQIKFRYNVQYAESKI